MDGAVREGCGDRGRMWRYEIYGRIREGWEVQDAWEVREGCGDKGGMWHCMDSVR